MLGILLVILPLKCRSFFNLIPRNCPTLLFNITLSSALAWFWHVAVLHTVLNVHVLYYGLMY